MQLSELARLRYDLRQLLGVAQQLEPYIRSGAAAAAAAAADLNSAASGAGHQTVTATSSGGGGNTVSFTTPEKSATSSAGVLNIEVSKILNFTYDM